MFIQYLANVIRGVSIRTACFIGASILLLSHIVLPVTAFAMTDEQRQLYMQNILYYDINQCSPTDTGGSTSQDQAVTGSVQEMAKQMLENSNISYWTNNGVNTRDVVVALSEGKPAYTTASNASNKTADINPNILKFILDVAKNNKIMVNALTDKTHSDGSNHYKGLAVDIDSNPGNSAPLTVLNPIAEKYGGVKNNETGHHHFDFLERPSADQTTATNPDDSVSTPDTTSFTYKAAGNIPKSGRNAVASIYGGTYKSGKFVPTNPIQDPSGQNGPSDDSGIGNHDNKLPGTSSFAELSVGLGSGDYSALGNLPNGTKLAITYKGKVVVAEKADVGDGGPEHPEIDLWWEVAKLLDFKSGIDTVNIRPVADDTPLTPVDGSAASVGEVANGGIGCVCAAPNAGDTAVMPEGDDNIEIAFKWFLQHGFNAKQAAGIVGNLQQESGVNPTSDNGSHRGIAQWDYGNRYAKLKNDFAPNKARGGHDPDSLSVQLEYIIWEFNHGYETARDWVKKADGVESAAKVFMENYEIVNDGTLPKRTQYGNQILEKYGGMTVDDSIGVVFANSCSDVVGAGQDSKYTDDGFVVYSQYSSSWKDKPYGSSTIGVSGCGPSAMAMIITNLLGKRVTPVETANYAASRGMYIEGSGSSWDIGRVVAEHWGLKATSINADIETINKELRSGGLVITPGQGPIPFTSGGHFIVIRGVTAEGKWKVGDSAHENANDQEWDPNQIVASMKANGGGGIYSIKKSGN